MTRASFAIARWAVFSAVFAALPLHAQEAAPAPAVGVASPETPTFPRRVTSESGTIVAYTPQIDSWEDYARLEGRIAVAVTPAGESEPVYGVAEFEATTDPNLELRIVAVENVEVTVTSFPVPDAARREQLDAIVRATMQKRPHYLPLDVILTYVAPTASIPDEPGLSFDPPPIFYSSTPAILVMTDGEPLFAPLPDTKLEYVVNTNWDLFRYKEKTWYLRNGKHWLTNKTLSGEWSWTTRLPGHFKKLPDDGNWDEVKAAYPAAKTKDDEPTVFVSDRPAEMIVTDGPPTFETLGAPGLEYASDTDSDLFRYKFKYYYLVSGRWFRADSLRGPWTHQKELPEIFASIPPDHPKGHVLAAVPGTDEARLAALEAQIPRKATVSRDAGEKINVFFQGEPEFEPIPGTSVERATNSYNDILKIGDQYYLCDNAVWYTATSTDGPWVVADSVPDEIYTIPASSPSYHVTHVHVYESDDDYVQTGYTSGYMGVYVNYGVPVYGSGWYYPPYYAYYPYYGYPYYPVYYPYPYSYGAAAWYNPNTGMYGRSGSVYGPYGGYGRAAAYNPNTGAYARGQAVWDSDEIAGRGVAYNPRTGTGVATNRYANESGGWGESLITHNDQWVATQSEWTQTSRNTDLQTSAGGSGSVERYAEGGTTYGSGEFQGAEGETLTTRSARNEQGVAVGGQTSTGESAGLVGGQTSSGENVAVGKTAEGDVYAGKDGNVYRRDEDGWQQNTGDGWSSVEVPDEAAAQMDETRGAMEARREDGSQAASERFAERNPEAGSFADSYRERGSAGDGSRRSYDSSRSGSFDSSRLRELDRSRSARTNGFERFQNRSFEGGNLNRQPRSGGRQGGSRRRR